ncbi:MAG: hypothetical protein DRH30_09285 [Deltaproteobacteria bacterium]|nr:MAG: hypothetical protein DRH30_09285 [Deltaproteobacteria bacterium]
MDEEKKKIVTLLRNLADALEKEEASMAVAAAWVMLTPDGGIQHSSFYSHQHVTSTVTLATIRGEIARLSGYADAVDKQVLSKPTLQ